MIKVAKFGGSSVSDAAQFQKVKAIVQADPARRLIVVSAAGKRSAEDHKLTDLLYLCHAHLNYGVPCDEIFSVIRSRLLEIRDSLGLRTGLEQELDALKAGLSKDTSVDDLVSRGEYFTARMMADFLGFPFIDAASCVFFRYDGQIDRERTYEAIRQQLKEHGSMVLPGFYGSLPSGRCKVMTRGGSDITGALAAAAVDAEVYENWTDVSGILMADPKIVPHPKPIQRITYGELRELAFMGASVLHEESVLPVKEKGIPLNIRNTDRPQDPGTLIVESAAPEEGPGHLLTGIAGRRNFDILTIRKRELSGTQDLRTVLELFDRFRVPVEHITMGLDSFALVASAAALGDSLYDLLADIKKLCKPDDISVQEHIALVAAVGRKMTFRPGASGRVFKALGDKGVNIRTIAQGADELSIIVGVDNSQFETAIRILYDGFGE